MAIHLNLKNVADKNEKTPTKIHWMPCVIKTDGEAKVSKYFEPLIVKRKDGIFQNSFRGRPLLGKEIEIPDNYTGVILQETNDKFSEEEDRDFYGVSLFKRFIYWNWDVEPSHNDKISMALEWLSVAEALHSSDNS